MSAPLPLRPWYREVWPWLLMLPPLASVIGGVTMVYLAVGAPEALVVDDYSRIEEITRERHAAERRASELRVAARVAVVPEGDARVAVLVELAGAAELAGTERLVLRMRHAAHAAADRTVMLTLVDGAYRGAAEVAVGRYELELGPPDASWLVAGTLASGARTAALQTAASGGSAP